MSELRPCPFCGADAELVHNAHWDYFVRCTDKQCAARTRLHHENENGAVDAWNRRTKWYAPVERRCCRCRHWAMVKDGSLRYCELVNRIREADDFCSRFEEA